MSAYASTTKGRNEAEAEIERMIADIAMMGRELYAIYAPPDLSWIIETISVDGNISEHTGATLDEAYLKALAWPATPLLF